jgi:hypothetical protein
MDTRALSAREMLVAVLLAAVALVAWPAEAASKKGKSSSVKPAAEAPLRVQPNAVYDSDGKILGVDPDPFIRLMIRRDPRPWDGVE